ncbi:5'-nucleotidase (lipoprotein e(P4) family) [Sphingomonas kyeonggiensis]|uniref:5'-nucleotidase (Lipoprotein e(P4) family) n=1 Tax=Sphingomonas kyeonggiensis TaxID=1268553 RepID=A0A7W7K5L0_9SPHN|nr:HAD family acid phosphatase [Sphingomonas kyeonggiensis]MBB4840825.1 5'-nucleotidase (lipoprotein e(P4) family) [Sphingomonas kyeonggiensis]
MTSRLAIAGLALAATGLSGCVAAVAAVPLMAGAQVVKTTQDGKARKQSKREKQAVPRAGDVYVTEDGKKAQVTGLTALPPPSGAPTAAAVAPGKVPPEMQFLYGSGEASALSLQAYAALWRYLHDELRFRRDKSQISSVVMTRDSTLTSPKFDTCGKRPLAVVFDVDETVLLNLGFESDAARRGPGYDQGRWTRWEETGADKVDAVPGAAETIAAIRGDGITVIYNTNRSASTAAFTIDALNKAGLGPVTLGDTLILRDDSAPSGKDERRWKIAERYCIVAMGGDQLGDFSDLFNAKDLSTPARRNTTGNTLIAPLWGRGWFILPNPVYGSGLKGGMDEVFPKDKQWADPAEEKK